MSKVVKSVGKVFKKVVSSKIFKIAAMAAAAYFTFGIALSMVPATSAFAAGMPLFSGAAGAGTGIFSQFAGSLGLGGGLASGGGLSSAATLFGGPGILGGTQLGGAAAAGGATATAPTTAAGGAVESGAGAAGTQAGAAVTKAGIMSVGGSTAPVAAGGATAAEQLTQKLLLAQLGTAAIGAFTAPTPDEIAASQAKFRGSYYGMDDKGNTAPAPNFSAAPTPAPSLTNAAPAPQVTAPTGQDLIPPPSQPPTERAFAATPGGSIAPPTPTQQIEDLLPKGRSMYG